jgi:hypothetical protein
MFPLSIAPAASEGVDGMGIAPHRTPTRNVGGRVEQRMVARFVECQTDVRSE